MNKVKIIELLKEYPHITPVELSKLYDPTEKDVDGIARALRVELYKLEKQGYIKRTYEICE